MRKNSLTFLIEISLIIWAFSKSIILGIFILVYIIHINGHIKNLLEQILAGDEEKKDPEDPFRIPKMTPNKIYPYRGCVIEHYPNLFLIIKQNGQRLERYFFDIEKAKEEIDLISPSSERERK